MVVPGGLAHIRGEVVGAIIVTIVYDVAKDYYHYSLARRMLLSRGIAVSEGFLADPVLAARAGTPEHDGHDERGPGLAR